MRNGQTYPVSLTVTGRQTDPDGNMQENTAVYRGSCSVCDGGRLLSCSDAEGGLCLYLSRRKAWIEYRNAQGTLQGTRMVFDPALAAARCEYRTPFGTIPMSVTTHAIRILDGGGTEQRSFQARLSYTLSMEPDYALKCAVTIKARQL